jgi:hypothetical protein
MALLSYKITNRSFSSKIFTYFSGSTSPGSPFNVTVPGKEIRIVESYTSPIFIPNGISDTSFISNSYIPPSGSAYLWNNGDKVQYIKISNTPLTGSNIGTAINKAKWIEFSMVESTDKDGNYLYPTSPNIAQIERYVINNALDEGLFNFVTIDSSSPETSIAISANSASSDTGFSYIDQQATIDQDCNPLLNNATEPRINEWLQDVDYSVNAITPINFDQILNGSATKAAIPQSNYTQLGFVNSRYVGSSTTRTQINEYDPSSIVDIENKFVYSDEAPSFFINKGKGSPLGKIPNVELNNAYIAYFNKIVDPYPQLNNKVAYYIKYLIDEGGNILDPNVSDINFSIFKDTFQLRDYDNKPTRVNTAISSIEDGKELVKLTDGLHPVHKIGAYPVPILYTQTSSIGYASEISLSGSQFYSALGLGKDFIKLGIDIFSTQSDAPTATNRTQSLDIDINQLEWQPIDITPVDNNASPSTNFPTSSNFPTYVILFPTNDNNSPQSAGAGNILSDNYVVKGSFTFTTSTIPAEYSGRDTPSISSYLKDYDDRKPYRRTQVMQTNLVPYRKSPLSPDNVGNYIVNSEGFNIKGVKLIITVDPGGSNENIYPSLTIENKPQGYNSQWALSSTGFTLTPDSLYIEDLIIQKLLNQNNVTNVAARRNALPLIAGGWATDGGNIYGYGGRAVKYDWVIEFEFSNILQGTGLFLEANSSILVSQSGAKHGFPFAQRPDDVFLFFGNNGSPNNNLQWRRTFTPTYATGVATKPILKYSVTSPLSENSVQNTANGPFWRRYPINGNPANAFTSDELFMSSSILNQTYSSSFIQAKLPYNGAVSTDFPLTVEPSFIEFDPVTDFWGLQEGDEIRFENNENLTFAITSVVVDPTLDKDINSNLLENKLRVKISPPFEYTASNGNIIINQPTNFDFFVVRRYKENKNFIILDQQMPYTLISGSEPVKLSSSPGLLLSQYRVDKFNTNPDLVLKDLIEKGIIT